MPVHKIQGGYQYGKTGKKYYGKDAKKKAKLQELAIRLSGYKEDDEKKKRRYLKHEADSESIGREFISDFFNDDQLQHHGILGQKWGIRRYQPYSQGYDAKKNGKFIGKRQQRKNVREIQRISMKAHGTPRGTFDIPVKIRQTKMAQEYLQSEPYKKALEKHRKLGKEISDTVHSMEYHEYVHENMSKKKFDEMTKRLQTMNTKYDKQSKALQKLGEEYADSVLGKYGNREAASSYIKTGSDLTARDRLTYALDPMHESGDAVTAMKRLSKQMASEIKYKDFSRLKSHDQVAKSKSGDCHSQVMYEVEELDKYGIDPKAKFFIEYDPKTNQGGQTHSFVYFKDPVTKKTIWLENAWGSQKGVHEYSSEKAMLKGIMKKHRAEQTQDREKFTKVQWGDFNPKDHVSGETLQELVNKCLK